MYFTQTLLPKYINEHQGETANWWVVYDARGNFIEPHTSARKIKTIPIGTLEIDKYLSDIHSHEVDELKVAKAFDNYYPTRGPENRFSAILFIEKEGFNPLFE